MTDTEEHDTTPGASTDGRAACVGESIRGLRERAGQTRGQVAGMMRGRGHAWHAGTVADIEEGRRQLGLLEAGDLLEGARRTGVPRVPRCVDGGHDANHHAGDGRGWVPSPLPDRPRRP